LPQFVAVKYLKALKNLEIMKSIIKKNDIKKLTLLIFAITTGLVLTQGQGQPRLSIKGQLKDQQNMQAVAYATVALKRSLDSTFITGVASNADGEFSLENISKGNYCLIISAIGYYHITMTVDLTSDYNAGTILLQQKSVALGEIVVTGERVKAKTGIEKTTYFVNKKMYDASVNGVDILNFIPGVQVDIMKNISLVGSQKIVILVDGRERDRNFLSQLNAKQIDKVEITDTPGSKYDADVNGVINIILKKDISPGIDGHIHLEVPTSQSTIYIFPDYSFNYNINKINLYTSYDGNLSYFNITENSYRNNQNSNGLREITSDQVVRQKYWSHRFHFGLGYNLNENNQLNFYAFYNPYSSEHSGNAVLHLKEDKPGSHDWSALKLDHDINYSIFYTVNYKHVFNKPTEVITFDLSYFNFRAVNSTTFISSDSIFEYFPARQANVVKPEQSSFSFKVDYTTPVTDKIRLDFGIKTKSQILKDRESAQFKYNESIFSLYGAITYSYSKYSFNAGIRAEKSTSGQESSFNYKVLALLPNATINYKITSKQNLKIAYNRTISRPNIYDLNPFSSSDDPFSIKSGNTELKPEFRQNISIDYSKNFRDNYLSAKVFYSDRSEAINQYTFINEAGIFETHIANMGNIRGYGFQITGALKFGKSVAINPSLNVTQICTSVNNLSKLYDINNRQKMALQAGLSAIVNFKYDIIASLQFQYNSPLIQIQTVSFSDALYIVSMEKSFNKKFKFGISCALPFMRTFRYQGSEIRGADFYSHSEGNIRFSVVPVWFKLTYLFNSGKAVNRDKNSKEDIDIMPKKGF
jgi:outer membrane receptor protein involved in Fe transport